MNQINHVSAEDIALYAQGDVREIDVVQIEEHLGSCQDCRIVVLMQRELRDAEALGLLPPPEEQLSMARIKGQTDNGDRKEKQRSWKQMLGIAGPLWGGLELEHLFPHHRSPALASDHSAGHDRPALAHGHEEGSPTNTSHDFFSSTNVRNDRLSPSTENESAHHRHFQADEHHARGGAEVNTASVDGGFTEAQKAYGLPASHSTSDYVHQQYADTCAVQCQHVILNQFGIDVSEDQLVKEAKAHGIYTPGHGTSLNDVGTLLVAHGIPIHRIEDANVFNLAVELSQGHKVIVGVEAGELWHTNSTLESIASHFGIGTADHAVIVSGIDTSHPGHETVIVTDPGTGDVAKEYPLIDFLHAWQGSHFSMVSTAIPTPQFNPEMVNFDYKTGHIQSIGHVPYELVHDMSNQAAHDPEPTVLHHLENIFTHLASGDLFVSDVLGALVHDDPNHHSFHDLAGHLVDLSHGHVSDGALSALMESISDLGAFHTAATEYHNPTHDIHSDASGGPQNHAFDHDSHHHFDPMDGTCDGDDSDG